MRLRGNIGVPIMRLSISFSGFLVKGFLSFLKACLKGKYRHDIKNRPDNSEIAEHFHTRHQEGDTNSIFLQKFILLSIEDFVKTLPVMTSR